MLMVEEETLPDSILAMECEFAAGRRLYQGCEVQAKMVKWSLEGLEALRQPGDEAHSYTLAHGTIIMAGLDEGVSGSSGLASLAWTFWEVL